MLNSLVISIDESVVDREQLNRKSLRPDIKMAFDGSAVLLEHGLELNSLNAVTDVASMTKVSHCFCYRNSNREKKWLLFSLINHHMLIPRSPRMPRLDGSQYLRDPARLRGTLAR